MIYIYIYIIYIHIYICNIFIIIYNYRSIGRTTSTYTVVSVSPRINIMGGEVHQWSVMSFGQQCSVFQLMEYMALEVGVAMV